MDTTQRSVREEIARRMLRTTRIGPTAVARYVDLPRADPDLPSNSRARRAMLSGLLAVLGAYVAEPGKISSTIARPSSTRKRTSNPAKPKPYTLCGSS